MARPHRHATTDEVTYTSQPTRGQPRGLVCRRCGESESSMGTPVGRDVRLCGDCQADLDAGGPDDMDVEELIDGMDD